METNHEACIHVIILLCCLWEFHVVANCMVFSEFMIKGNCSRFFRFSWNTFVLMCKLGQASGGNVKRNLKTSDSNSTSFSYYMWLTVNPN